MSTTLLTDAELTGITLLICTSCLRSFEFMGLFSGSGSGSGSGLLLSGKSHDKSVYQKKSHIRETKHLLTDADRSTNTTVGWTKNTQKPDFFEKGKIIQNAKTQERLEICQN